jgi:hypothetical protein
MKRRQKITLWLLLCAVALAQNSFQSAATVSQTPAGAAQGEAAAIRQTALDYIEGWYEGNAERMERALHPELAKRIVQTNPANGRSSLGQQSAMTLVQNTRSRAGRATPKEQQQKEVTILDVFEGAASVRIVATEWIDYLHVAKFNGRWVIVNVLWELRPARKKGVEKS